MIEFKEIIDILLNPLTRFVKNKITKAIIVEEPKKSQEELQA